MRDPVKRKASRERYLKTPEAKAKRAEYGRRYWAEMPMDDPRRLKHNERTKMYTRDYATANFKFTLKKHGMTAQSYEEMAAQQGYVCAICLRPEVVKGKKGEVKRLAIDHCHTTGRVRGLLCAGCNPGLGHFQDSSGLLRAAADYLEKP